MSVESSGSRSPTFAVRSTYDFIRDNAFSVFGLSALLLVPCFWHSRIQAGDLGSHVYNAWLAQLIEHRQLQGLTLVFQWNNVLSDLLVLHIGNVLGFIVAEKIVVSFAVLIFFWGCFSFIAKASGRPPWLLAPFLLALAYGYAFHMGFMNYYLSLGFAFLALALAWRGGAGNWLLALALSCVSLVAHPIGFLFAVVLATYICVWRSLSGWIRMVLPAIALAFFVCLRVFFLSHEVYQADWREAGFFQLFGQDQLNRFGHRYVALSWVGFAWGVFCALAAIYDWIFRGRPPATALRFATELYVVAIVATVCLPENCQISIYAGWVGLLVSRLTLVTAVFGLLVLATFHLPRWSISGNCLFALVFFLFLYQDTGKLDRLEGSARDVVHGLPVGTRIVAVANAPGDWRIQFIYHSIERACIGRCFSFANYEPSSLQFRVRAIPGNYFVTASVDQSDDMSSGEYVVRKQDLPLTAIYQCDDADFTQLCALPLREGQKTEDPESEPVPMPSADGDSDTEN